MMGWVKRVLGYWNKRATETAVATAVDDLEGRSQVVAREAADRMLDGELWLAYQAMLSDRRHQNVGHRPERRR